MIHKSFDQRKKSALAAEHPASMHTLIQDAVHHKLPLAMAKVQANSDAAEWQCYAWGAAGS